MLQTLGLDGTWKLRWSDGQRNGKPEYANREFVDESRYIDAQVPGEVHLDAWRAGWISDPCLGINCLAARWVEECIWSYRKEFEVPASVVNARAWLVFEGLDYGATVLLNGIKVGEHHNFFYPCRLDVTGKLRQGHNWLTVHLDSGLFEVADKPAKGFIFGIDELLHKRHWLRKPINQFGFDWSPRLINVGIHKPVRLEWTDDPLRMDQLVALADVSQDLKQGTVVVRQFVEGLLETDDQTAYPNTELVVELIDTGAVATTPVKIKPGLHPYEARIELDDPKLWWPVGHGPQNLYSLKVALAIDGESVAQRITRVGFRHVRFNQDPHPEGGRYFFIEVNGKPIFAKGANFVPADMIFARLDRERYETLIDRALEANFNYFRVWGGGLYESEDFYELCDERGILVWQEFSHAVLALPAYERDFNANIVAESTYQIRRLASHPSLIAWCGNNEIEGHHWRGVDRGQHVLPEYGLFHLILPRLLTEEDPTRYYQPSSPFSPDVHDPNWDDAGDQHPWGVGFANTDFRDYRKMTCRFAHEGGVLGPRSLPTMMACLPEGQREIDSFAWRVHDNSYGSLGEPSYQDLMIEQWLGIEIGDLSVEQFTYWGGLLQGEALGEYCANFRRRKFDSAGAVFWMYNDCWPATRSWAIVDYYLRRTPAFYFVRRALAPIHIVVAEEEENVVIFGINEQQQALEGELRYGVFNVQGGYPMDRRLSVVLPSNASTRLASFKMDEWQNRDASAAFSILSRDGEMVARNRLFHSFFKDIAWSPPDARVRREGDKAVFECDTFVWGVCLDLDGEIALSDNFFDIYPGIPYSIPWYFPEDPTIYAVGDPSR